MQITLTEKDLFSNVECTLGEGLLWHNSRQSLFWLDIIEKKLFEKKIDSKNQDFDYSWNLPEMGSALALNENNEESIFIITDKSFGQFCLKTGVYTPKLPLNLPENLRSNDGSVSPDGWFWFGSMEKKPSGKHGAIYSISPQGKLVNALEGIGIPNTFCWSENGETIYLSDSLHQKMFTGLINTDKTLSLNYKEPFIDLSETSATPDGGAYDAEGNLWNAQWGESKVQCYSPKGDVICSIELPVSQVSNCCFGGPNNQYLFITTAREHLSPDILQKQILSGGTFVVKLAVHGRCCHSFSFYGN